jgi:hypothetical protein
MTLFRLWAALLLWLPSLIFPRQTALPITPNQLIQAVNAVRTARGLPALRLNAVLMGTAQYRADMMASSQAASQLAGLKEYIVAAGYGSGSALDSIWATEDYAVSATDTSAAQIVSGNWSDEAHMIPMTSPYYCDVGAGVSQASSGDYYYVLHAAYNSDVPCGKPAPTGSAGKQTTTPTAAAPQWIEPITRSTPDADGRIFHIVRQGQSLWYIAISYGTKINAIQALNNMQPDNKTLYNGEKLLIPTSLTPLPTVTPSPAASPTQANTITALPTALRVEGTLVPSPVPTLDPTEQAAMDERFRGGLFLALVISVVLIVAGFLINRR